jgi:hypothetical protein
MTMHRNFEANLHPGKLVFSPHFRLQLPWGFPQFNFEETWFRQTRVGTNSNQVGAFQSQAVEGKPS